jgi:hypothetical protein
MQDSKIAVEMVEGTWYGVVWGSSIGNLEP